MLTELKNWVFSSHISRGKRKTIIGIIGDFNREEVIQSLGAYPEIERLVPIQEPYKLVGRSFKEDDTIINIDGINIGSKKITIIAGPCSVESEEQIIGTARTVKKAGAQIFKREVLLNHGLLLILFRDY